MFKFRFLFTYFTITTYIIQYIPKTFNFFFFDPFELIINKFIFLNKINFLHSYDIIFSNSYNFTTLLFSIFISFGFVLFLLLQANLLNLSFYPNSTFDSEKYSPYECGFAPFWTERAQFDIKFYLVALLFLVFDVELMFLLPYCISYYYLDLYGYFVFIIFFVILIIGFLVEWAVGMLVWKGENNLANKNTKKEKTQLLFENTKWNHCAYVNFYLVLFDFKWLSWSIWKYSKISSFYTIWRIKFWRPYLEWFYNQPEKIELVSNLDPNKQLVYYGFSDCFFGSITFSFYDVFLQTEKKEKQDRIERFFIRIYGEPYKAWLETLTPEQRDFAF